MSLAHQSSNYQYTWNIDLCSLVCIALSIGILLQNYLCWYNQVWGGGKKEILNVIDYLLIENSSTETSIL